jgi:CDP-diacylglycerol--serine O-phosphatidyltransferase
MFISDKIPFITEYLLVLCSSYLIIGFGMGLVQRKKIIEEAKEEK